MENINYYQKYLKYKHKYLQLKGGQTYFSQTDLSKAANLAKKECKIYSKDEEQCVEETGCKYDLKKKCYFNQEKFLNDVKNKNNLCIKHKNKKSCKDPCAWDGENEMCLYDL